MLNSLIKLLKHGLLYVINYVNYFNPNNNKIKKRVKIRYKNRYKN